MASRENCRLKFHPVCYFHVFILGMLLAKLRQLLDKRAVSNRHGADSWRNPYVIALQFVAPVGYLVLMLVFSVEGFQARLWGYKLSARRILRMRHAASRALAKLFDRE